MHLNKGRVKYKDGRATYNAFDLKARLCAVNRILHLLHISYIGSYFLSESDYHPRLQSKSLHALPFCMTCLLQSILYTTRAHAR